jgi:hypothetical protein
MDGMVNSQNVSRTTMVRKMVAGQKTSGKYPAKLMVFLGVHGSGQTWGLKLYKNETIDGDEYHRPLRYTAIPALKSINGGTLDGMY